MEDLTCLLATVCTLKPTIVLSAIVVEMDIEQVAVMVIMVM